MEVSPRAGDGRWRRNGLHSIVPHLPAADADAENRPVARRPAHPRASPVTLSQSSDSDGDALRMRRARRAVDAARSPHFLPPSGHPEPPLRGSGLVTDEWRALTPRGDFGHSPATLHRSVLTKALAYACRRRRLTKPSAPTRSRPIVPGSGTVEAPTKLGALLPPLKEPRASPPEKVTVDPAPMLSEPSV